MSRRATLLLAALVASAPPAGFAAAASPRASAALLDGLRRSGRAEASIAFVVQDPIGGESRPTRGRLALEPPDLARLDFPASGEAVTLRADGGEWLQPAARQLLRLSREHSATALRWWGLLLDPRRADVRERRIAANRYRLVLEGGADSAEVVLDGRGLPSALVIGGPDASTSAKLSGWRFVRARGPRAFKLAVPAGYADVEMP